jgi:hypothetical protein
VFWCQELYWSKECYWLPFSWNQQNRCARKQRRACPWSREFSWRWHGTVGTDDRYQYKGFDLRDQGCITADDRTKKRHDHQYRFCSW